MFSLVYNLLYIRFGNHEKIQEYMIRNGGPVPNGFYKYEPSEELKEYIDIIPTSSTSIFSFSKEEVAWIKSLGFTIEIYDITVDIYSFIINKAMDSNHKEFKVRTVIIIIGSYIANHSWLQSIHAVCWLLL